MYIHLKFIFLTDMTEGSPCRLPDNAAGTCVIDRECGWAVDQLKHKLLMRSQLVRCGWKGQQTLICCKLNQRMWSQGKAEQACELFKNIKVLDLAPQILYGYPANFGEFPHIAAIGYRNSLQSSIEYDCGGTLISQVFVMTAAHCANKKNHLPTIVRLGSVRIYQLF